MPPTSKGLQHLISSVMRHPVLLKQLGIRLLIKQTKLTGPTITAFKWVNDLTQYGFEQMTEG